jgi:hypothetical protein
MGYWESTLVNGKYSYTNDERPTLLAAGLRTQKVTSSDREVKVIMWPLAVDTEFNYIPDPANPPNPVEIGKPVSLFPISGLTANWTVKRGTIGDAGFTDLLAAQAKAGQSGPVSAATPQGFFYEGTEGNKTERVIDAKLTDNTISMDISKITGLDLEKVTSGAVAFKLTYIPFGLTVPGNWSVPRETELGSLPPEWIIRNGLNDSFQDDKTDFNNNGLNYLILIVLIISYFYIFLNIFTIRFFFPVLSPPFGLYRQTLPTALQGRH